jgi:signal transduction histidine kinase
MGAGPEVAAPVVLMLIATGAVAGYAHRLFVEAHQHHHETTNELLRLAQFNQQLLVLYHMAQTLPASLDLAETLEEARRHLDEAMELDVFAVLTADDGGDGWTVAASEGANLADRFTTGALPTPLRDAIGDPAGLIVDDLGPVDAGRGLDPRSRTGIYVSLHARGRVVGLLAVERRRPVPFTVPGLRFVHGIADSLALGIENARWFRRLRSLGAEEERTRIARELHDRPAQSLVYLGYELDRLVKGRPADQELVQLRDNVRTAVAELRETLVQLRSTVNAEHPLEVHVRQLAERFTRRTGVVAELRFGPVVPLPPRVEQEILRIVQEALNNVEHHAEAKKVLIGWSMRDGNVEVVVEDDGKGFDFDPSDRRPDAFGLLGMSERADTIGASLRIGRAPTGGTRVSLLIDSHLVNV